MALMFEPVYQIFNTSDTYVGTIRVSNEFSFSQEINTAAAEMVMVVPVPKSNSVSFQTFLATYLVINYKVRVYTDGTGGAASQFVTFEGYISKVEHNYADNTATVTVISTGGDFEQIILENAGATNRTYSSVDVGTMITTSGGDYTLLNGRVNIPATITTGTTASYSYNCITMNELMAASLGMLPSTWYWHVPPNSTSDACTLVVDEYSTTYDHLFIQGNHIVDLRLEKNLERIKNVVYFTGGDTGGGSNLYKKYSDATSISTYGRRAVKISDARVTVAATADAIGNAYLTLYKDPDYRTSVTIPRSVYNIDDIFLGDTVTFGGFDSTVDGLLLRVVRYSKRAQSITLDLGLLPNSAVDVYDKVRRDLFKQQALDNPGTPS